MARLRVRQRGKTVYDIALSEGQSYVAGRKEDCDIVLEPEKGISREHFKLSFAEGAWTVEVISRYGEVMANGEPAQHFTLEHGSQFSIPPYEFDYLESADESESYLPAVTGVGAADSFDGSDEKTVIGVAPTAAYIKITDEDNEPRELIRLEAGDSWVAGRDPSCHIQIRDQRVSRRQFEIRRSGSQYLIIDLGSVNGTLVNGSPISSTDPTSIKSGDAISVLSNYLYFELHDSSFQSRLEMVKVSPVSPLINASEAAVPMPYQYSPQEMAPYQGGGGMPLPYQMSGPSEPVAQGKFDFQKHRPKIIAGAVALLAVAY
ncbi:MAG: FHA domain-containing protein, partial [Bdellovibrio sp.]